MRSRAQTAKKVTLKRGPEEVKVGPKADAQDRKQSRKSSRTGQEETNAGSRNSTTTSARVFLYLPDKLLKLCSSREAKPQSTLQK